MDKNAAYYSRYVIGPDIDDWEVFFPNENEYIEELAGEMIKWDGRYINPDSYPFCLSVSSLDTVIDFLS